MINDINQRVVILSLQRFGYRADVAAIGYEAIASVASIEATDYDLVLMAVHIPELNIVRWFAESGRGLRAGSPTPSCGHDRS